MSKNKKIIYGILIIILLVFLLTIVLRGSDASINTSSNCGLYDENGALHSTCECLGIRTKVENYSHCWGIRFDYYE